MNRRGFFRSAVCAVTGISLPLWRGTAESEFDAALRRRALRAWESHPRFEPELSLGYWFFGMPASYHREEWLGLSSRVQIMRGDIMRLDGKGREIEARDLTKIPGVIIPVDWCDRG